MFFLFIYCFRFDLIKDAQVKVEDVRMESWQNKKQGRGWSGGIEGSEDIYRTYLDWKLL